MPAKGHWYQADAKHWNKGKKGKLKAWHPWPDQPTGKSTPGQEWLPKGSIASNGIWTRYKSGVFGGKQWMWAPIVNISGAKTKKKDKSTPLGDIGHNVQKGLGAAGHQAQKGLKAIAPLSPAASLLSGGGLFPAFNLGGQNKWIWIAGGVLVVGVGLYMFSEHQKTTRSGMQSMSNYQGNVPGQEMNVSAVGV